MGMVTMYNEHILIKCYTTIGSSHYDLNVQRIKEYISGHFEIQDDTLSQKASQSINKQINEKCISSNA